MANPQQVHYNEVLTNVSVRYSNGGYVATEIFPLRPVKADSDNFYVYDKTHFNVNNEATADHDVAPEISHGWKTDYYRCDAYRKRHFISDSEYANTNNAVDPDVDAATAVTDRMLLDYEYEVASYLTTTGNYTLSNTANANWTNYATATPTQDIATAKVKIFQLSAKMPNVMIVPVTVSMKMSLIDEIRNLKRYTNDLTPSGMIPANFQGLRVIEAGALYNTANRGQSNSFSEVWGDNIWIGYVDPNAGRMSLTFGFTFQSKARTMETYRMPDRKGKYVECEWRRGKKVVAWECAYLLQTVFTA